MRIISHYYDHLTDLSDDKYLEYIDAIESYLKSEGAYKFSAENFANTIVQVIADDINIKEGENYESSNFSRRFGYAPK